MLSTLLIVALLATLCVAGNSQLSFSPGFPYGSQPVRGVNLGGWLVLEVCYRLAPL
jgi:glucan 1,3-beta-glucosidase